jgi:hypothetical protein
MKDKSVAVCGKRGGIRVQENFAGFTSGTLAWHPLPKMFQ